MTARYCLVGRGIDASPSPAMQNAAFRAAHVDATYELCDVDSIDLGGLVTALHDGTYEGCNVTIPHKSALAASCDELVDDAHILQAVNTITRADDGTLIGHNTDAAGFERALGALGLRPQAGCAAVVLGSGGAAAAVMLAMQRVPAGSLTVIARNAEKGVVAARRAAPSLHADVVEWSDDAAAAAAGTAAIVINATAAGLADLPISLHELPRSCTVADVRYRPRPVDVVAAALAAGHPACDGVEMLLQQGMRSFEIWTRASPPWAEARQALNEALAG